MNPKTIDGIAGRIEIQEVGGGALELTTADFWADGDSPTTMNPEQVEEVRDALTAWLVRSGRPVDVGDLHDADASESDRDAFMAALRAEHDHWKDANEGNYERAKQEYDRADLAEARVEQLETALMAVLDWATRMPGFHIAEPVREAQQALEGSKS